MALIERREHFAYLDDWLTDEVADRSRIALVEGPVGVGKTSLLRAFAQRATERNVLVLTATCAHRERAVPLGVVNQLFRTTNRASRLRDLACGHLDEASRSVAVPGPAVALALGRLSAVLLQHAEDAPVVLAVDDVEHADALSREWLAVLVGRMGLARLLVVVAHGADHTALDDLVGRPGFHRMPLAPLSRTGVAHLLHDLPGAEDRAGEFHTATGGNPRLLHALLDHGEPGTPNWSNYGQAVLACLRGSSPFVTRVARALAVCGPDPAATAELTGFDQAAVNDALRTMTEAGVLLDNDFRHPAARTRVLDDLADSERRDLHRRAARHLRLRGAQAHPVARHLVAAGSPVDAWAVEVLLEAAEQLVGEGRVEQAVDFLEFALRAHPAGETGAVIRTRLAQAEWQSNPATAARHLPDLLAAARDRLLGTPDLLRLLRQLLWLGRVDDARELLRTTDLDDHSLCETRLWLACAHPTLVRAGHGPAPRTSPMMALAAAITAGRVGRIPALAGRVLDEPHGGAWGVEPVLLALQALLYADRATEANLWCDRLLADPFAERTPLWHAVVDAAKAEVACRHGNFPAAVDHAAAALTRVPPKAWGVAIGLPLGTAVLACTRMGHHRAAAEHLAQPVPESMYRSRFGPHYLHARGHHHLATQRVHAGLADFLSCGEALSQWGLDLSGIAPWRTSAAEARFRLGELDQARRLVRDQLTRPDVGASRARGAALRLLARTSEPSARVRVLTEAMTVLEARGDQFELARVLGDLSRAHHQLGRRRRARMVMHRAWHVANTCHATPLCRQLLPEATELATTRSGDQGGLSALTTAERRVASLAAMGYTNREISRKLYITTSTVEQHLTKVFRKLDIRQRGELPLDLCANVPKIA